MSQTTTRTVLLLLGASLLLPAGPAVAQEPLPAVLPDILFLVEDSSRMAQDWDGDGSLASPDARWIYVRDGIIQAMQNAPLGMRFGVALTADGSSSEATFDFEPLAYPGMPVADIITALNAHTVSSNGDNKLAETYANLIDNYMELSYGSPSSWTVGPFQYTCSKVIVIVIGHHIGENDGAPEYLTTPASGDVLCNDATGFQGCYLDDTANYAYNTFVAPQAGTGSVETHSILIDSNSPGLHGDAAALYQAAANSGQGLYYEAVSPSAIPINIWTILSEVFEGSYSNAAISMTPGGDTLFAAWYDVLGGHPLYKGHLAAWEIQTDPTEPDYGQIVPNASALNGELWDAGWRLASRDVKPAVEEGQNQNAFDPEGDRNGYTSYITQLMLGDLQPFDRTSLGSDTTDLAELLISSPVSLSGNPSCIAYEAYYDFDCDVDRYDAQLLVDFIRGAPSSVFLNTGLPRGTWRLGDTGHSTAVAAPSAIEAVSTQGHFLAYREKLTELPGMTYVASNGGMLHAFYLGYLLDGDNTNAHDGNTMTHGSEYWFYVPRAKANLNHAEENEFESTRLDKLMTSGQTSVNSGHVEVTHVWLDGYSNGLTDCSAPGYSSGMKNGSPDAGGCEWHRVVTWSAGYGGRHHYALDVTTPAAPRFLWERTDSSSTGGGEGRAVGAHAVAEFWDAGLTVSRRWVTVWGSGSQGPGVSASTPATEWAQAGVYIHDMDSDVSESPTDYNVAGFVIDSPETSFDSDPFDEYQPPDEGMFGSPALVDLDSDGGVDVGFFGDSNGRMYKVLFNPDNADSPSRCLFNTPESGDAARHMYYRPAVFFGQAGELLVYYGSGSPFNIYSAINGGLYVRADPEPYGCTASVAAPCAADSSLFDSAGFYGFTGGSGEKLVGHPQVVFGRMFFSTHIPGDDPCTNGTSRLYGLNVATCGGGIFDIASDSHDVTSNLYTEVDGLISQPVFANNRLYALNIDGSGISDSSIIDTFQVTPDSFSRFTQSSFRHVF